MNLKNLKNDKRKGTSIKFVSIIEHAIRKDIVFSSKNFLYKLLCRVRNVSVCNNNYNIHNICIILKIKIVMQKYEFFFKIIIDEIEVD